jgi:hypothetical protein
LKPIQALDTPQVHPRVKLSLPFSSCSEGESNAIIVDAFKLPDHIKHAPAFQLFRDANPKVSIQKSAKAMGLNWITCKRAAMYLRLMETAGVVDPFTELTSPPAKASRWRKQSLASEATPVAARDSCSGGIASIEAPDTA